MSKPVLWEKNKKNIISLSKPILWDNKKTKQTKNTNFSSAVLAQNVVKINKWLFHVDNDGIPLNLFQDLQEII